MGRVSCVPATQAKTDGGDVGCQHAIANFAFIDFLLSCVALPASMGRRHSREIDTN
jgi:hypothetical protein